VNWDLAWAQLVSSTSWAEHDETSRQDGTGVFGVFIDSTLPINKFTQELRLASNDTDSKLEWLIGGYFTHERASLHQDLVGTGLFLELTSKFIEQAAFANFTYHFTEAFDVALGGRYSSNSQSARQFGLAAASGTSEEDVFTWSVAPRLHLSEDTMLYARVAKGYRPGGPNALPPPPIPAGVPFAFEADTAINYEVGIKTDLLDGRLQLDADLFLTQWDNIQLLVFIPGFGGVNGNGETAETKGFEAAAAWALTDQLTVRATIAYIDAYLTADTDPVTIGALDGDPLPNIPDWSGSLSADYRFETDGTWQPWIGATWRHVGDRFSGFDAGIGQIPLEGYDSLDFRLGMDHGLWTMQLYAKNVTDERGIIDIGTQNFSVVSGTGTATVITPRTIGVAVTGRF
jgi:iron complex outermembrane recepter protein